MDMPERSNDRPISLKDHFRFRCSRCTACCRHVTGVVPLNPLDVFKLTRYLRDHETGPVCTDDVLMHFASPSMLTGAGYFVYFIRSVGEDERCVFLNGNRCSIQESKPVACRMYPLEAAPEVDGSFHIVLSTERTHHFTGNPIKVKNWFYRNMSEDMREFYRYDFDSASGINKLLEAVPEEKKDVAMLLFHQYRYSDFDLDSPFMPQFKANTEKLISELKTLAESKGGTHHGSQTERNRR